MNSPKFFSSAHGLRWLFIVILVMALAGCNGGSSGQSGNSSSQTGNPVNNESVLNQNSGTGG